MPDPEDESETIVIGRKPAPDPAAKIIGHYLVVSKEGEEGTRVEVGAEPLTIGRDVLADTEVSRLHARVSLLMGGAVVEDLGSTNGTLLGGQRLTKPVQLKEGDVLRMGSHLLQYERRCRRSISRTPRRCSPA